MRSGRIKIHVEKRDNFDAVCVRSCWMEMKGECDVRKTSCRVESYRFAGF